MELALCSRDEKERGRVEQMLRQWMFFICGKVDFLVCSSGEELFSCYAPGRFAFLFLDIESDGLDCARQIRSGGDSCQIAFLSDDPGSALACYEVHPAGFFLKPVKKKQLFELLRWHRALFLPAMDCITVQVSRSARKVLMADILYVSVAGRSSFLHMKGETLQTNRTLSELSRELEKASFFRCHREYLVNPVHISGLFGRSLAMDDGENLPVSESRLEEARQWVQHVKKFRIS